MSHLLIMRILGVFVVLLGNVTEDIKALMKKPGTYSVYRDRLINKHIVDGDVRGYLKIQLPRFDKFIEIWG